MSSGILPGWSPSRANRNRWLELIFLFLFLPDSNDSEQYASSLGRLPFTLTTFLPLPTLLFSLDEVEGGTIFIKEEEHPQHGGAHASLRSRL